MFTLLSSLIVIDITWSDCPDSNLLKPCSCRLSVIECGGKQDIDLVKIFQTLEKNLTKTGKHFNEFYLNNTFISELKENTFSYITFDYIEIEYCSKLKNLHRNAFNTSGQVTNTLVIS